MCLCTRSAARISEHAGRQVFSAEAARSLSTRAVCWHTPARPKSGKRAYSGGRAPAALRLCRE
eukprot:8184645-Alexandrium_andersonii.AAC.1